MAQRNTPADKMVLTEADTVPPPQPAVPEPPARHQAGATAKAGQSEPDVQALLEVKALAERVGGLQRLRELVDVLLKLQK